jgi:hypothetical protein
MARLNACSELTAFWLESRHGCLVTENVPVPVPFGQSDIDIVAVQPAGGPIVLPDGRTIGPRLIVETKDEHDYDPRGTEFAKLLIQDVHLFSAEGFVPTGTKTPIKFTMLREAHFEKASAILGTADFDRLFVTHAMSPKIFAEVEPILTAHRISWLTIQDVVADLVHWYHQHPKPAGLRHSPIGDIWHLLVGYCGFQPKIGDASQ